jgi:hypothetical protein
LNGAWWGLLFFVVQRGIFALIGRWKAAEV